jgi:hypothetical protein
MVLALVAPATFYVLLAWAAYVFLAKAENGKQMSIGLVKTAGVGTVAALAYLVILGALIARNNGAFHEMQLETKANFLMDIAFMDLSTIFYLAYILLGVAQIRAVRKLTLGGLSE